MTTCQQHRISHDVHQQCLPDNTATCCILSPLLKHEVDSIDAIEDAVVSDSCKQSESIAAGLRTVLENNFSLLRESQYRKQRLLGAGASAEGSVSDLNSSHDTSTTVVATSAAQSQMVAAGLSLKAKELPLQKMQLTQTGNSLICVSATHGS